MPKFVKVEDRPVVEAIQVNWNVSTSVTVRDKSWIILHEDGTTTYCNDQYFKRTYMKACD